MAKRRAAAWPNGALYNDSAWPNGALNQGKVGYTFRIWPPRVSMAKRRAAAWPSGALKNDSAGPNGMPESI
jgi:hypothetical protein